MSIWLRRTFLSRYVNWASILLRCKLEVTYVTFRTDNFARIRLTQYNSTQGTDREPCGMVLKYKLLPFESACF